MITKTNVALKKLLVILALSFTFFTSFSQDDLIIDGVPCSIHGSSKLGSLEYTQNVFKNRYTFPTVSAFNTAITLQSLINSNADESRFSQDKAVKVSGYVFDVKPGGIETCNCKTTDGTFKDTHIELTPDNQHTDAQHRMIIEVTPRMRQIMEQKGVDWSTSTLKEKLKGHLVAVEGWLFYDKHHELEAFSLYPDDSKGRKNWRASCWEIHPITKIEVLDASDDVEMNTSDNESGMAVNNNGTPPNSTSPPQPISKPKTPPTMETVNTPLNTLIIILIGAILGAVGQGIRVLVGVKKVNDNAVKTNTDVNEALDYRQMTFSLVIAFAIGAIAGVLAAISSDNIQFSKATIIAFITAGYAGTDFIEGFIKKYPTVQNPNAPKNING